MNATAHSKWRNNLYMALFRCVQPEPVEEVVLTSESADRALGNCPGLADELARAGLLQRVKLPGSVGRYGFRETDLLVLAYMGRALRRA